MRSWTLRVRLTMGLPAPSRQAAAPDAGTRASAALDEFPAPLTAATASRLLTRICRPWIQRSLHLPVDADPAVARRLTYSDAGEMAQLLRWSTLPGLGLEALAEGWPKGSLQHDQLRALCRAEVLAVHTRDLRQEAALAELLQGLHAAGIAVAPYKGPHLAALLGLPAGLRPAADRDLWLQPDQLDNACAALERLGCRPFSSDPAVLDYMRSSAHDYHLLHPDIGLVELHHRAYPNMNPGTLQQLWSRMQPGEYLGVPVHVLDPNDLYVLLCVHLFRMGWTAAPKWLLDLLHFQVVLEAASGTANRPVAAPPAGHYLAGLNATQIAKACAEFGTAFEVLAMQAILGHCTDRRLPASATTGLRAQLSARESWALEWIESSEGLALSTDWMAYEAQLGQTRRSRANPATLALGEPPPPGWRTALWGHPGRIATELNIRSDQPGFWKRRAGWMLRRAARALAAAAGAGSTARLAASSLIAPAAACAPGPRPEIRQQG